MTKNTKKDLIAEASTHQVTWLPERILKAGQGKSKRVPTRKDPATGELRLCWEYMLLSEAEKRLRKVKHLVRKSFYKLLILTKLTSTVLLEKILWNIEYYFSTFIDNLRFMKKYLFKWLPQKLRRGFDDRELWCLDMTLIEFISKWLQPRIKAYKEMQRVGYPAVFKSQKEWEKILTQIEEGFQIIIEEGSASMITDKKKLKKARKAVELFSEHWLKLWD